MIVPIIGLIAWHADSATAPFASAEVNRGVSSFVWQTADAKGIAVPELSRFFGIIIAMYYNDHSPPHFHAKYGEEQASLRIEQR